MPFDFFQGDRVSRSGRSYAIDVGELRSGFTMPKPEVTPFRTFPRPRVMPDFPDIPRPANSPWRPYTSFDVGAIQRSGARLSQVFDAVWKDAALGIGIAAEQKLAGAAWDIIGSGKLPWERSDPGPIAIGLRNGVRYNGQWQVLSYEASFDGAAGQQPDPYVTAFWDTRGWHGVYQNKSEYYYKALYGLTADHIEISPTGLTAKYYEQFIKPRVPYNTLPHQPLPAEIRPWSYDHLNGWTDVATLGQAEVDSELAWNLQVDVATFGSGGRSKIVHVQGDVEPRRMPRRMKGRKAKEATGVRIAGAIAEDMGDFLTIFKAMFEARRRQLMREGFYTPSWRASSWLDRIRVAGDVTKGFDEVYLAKKVGAWWLGERIGRYIRTNEWKLSEVDRIASNAAYSDWSALKPTTMKH